MKINPEEEQNITLSAAFELAQGKKSRSLRRLWWALRPPEWREDLPFINDAFERNIKHVDEIEYLTYPTEHGIKKARAFALLNKPEDPVISYISGWKAHPLEDAEMEMISSIRDAGYNVISIALDDPGKDSDSLPANINRVKAFQFSQSSPLYQRYARGINSVVGLTHSTSGMVNQHCLNECVIPGQLRAAINTAPFFDTANSSSMFHPIKNWFYDRHAVKNSHKLAGDPFSDRMHYYFCGIADRLRHNDGEKRPTHGQILEISAYGAGILALAQNQKARGLPIPAQQLEQLFVISTDDSFACPDTAKIYADVIGAETLPIDQSDHNPLLNKKAREQIIERIGHYFEAPEQPIEFTDIPDDLILATT